MPLPLLVLAGALGVAAPWALQQQDQQQGRVPLAREASEWIPVELFLGAHVYLRARLNGVETDVVLDSDAGMSVIDAGLARRLRLEPASPLAGEEPDERTLSYVEPVELALGSVRLVLPRALTLDVGGVNTRIGRATPVILGRELFERFVVDLDYPNARLALREPASFVYRGPGHSLALLAGAPGELLVEASVEDLPPARFALDTGSPGLSLLATFTRRHGRLAERAHAAAQLGNAAPVRTTTLSSFTLAGHRFTNVPATLADAPESSLPTHVPDGRIGAGVLTRFRVVVDVSRARVHLEPASDCDTRPFARDRLGLAAAPRGAGLEVTFVAPGSPAAAEGWKVGERILALNGKPIDAGSSRASLKECVEAPPGTEVLLTDGEGRVRRLVAADYP